MGGTVSTGYSVRAKSYVCYLQMTDTATEQELIPHYLINPLIAFMAQTARLVKLFEL